MEAEERCGNTEADFLEAEAVSLDNLWQSFDWDCPGPDQSVPGSGVGGAQLGFITSPADMDWEKLLDAEEIEKLWPGDFTVSLEGLGSPPVNDKGTIEPAPWVMSALDVNGGTVPQSKPVACEVQGEAGIRVPQRASETSSSASQISIERQSEEKRSGQEQAKKRARSEDGDGSSEGDADSPEDSKKRARLVRNRESASASRERKRQRMLDMEQRCASLEAQVKSLSRAVTATALENAALREELARQQMYRFTPPATTAPPSGRSRGRGAKKSTRTEPAVLSSDSLPWSSLFYRSPCPPSPQAPSPLRQQQPPLASGPFLLFALLLVWLASQLGSAGSKSSSLSQDICSHSVCSLRVVSLGHSPLLRRRRRGKQKARRVGLRRRRKGLVGRGSKFANSRFLFW